MDFFRRYKNVEEFKDNYYNLEITNKNHTSELRNGFKKYSKIPEEWEEFI